MSIFSRFFNKTPDNGRRNPRVFGTGISVKIDSHVYYAADASISGIKLKNCKEDYPEGMTLNVEIQFVISHKHEKLPAKAVVWKNNTDGLILRFKKLPTHTRNVYGDFIKVSAVDFS